MYKIVKIVPSASSTKKYDVFLRDKEGKEHKVSFGAKGYSDFTKHKDEERKKLYIARHKAREDWTRSGVLTAGFWSRWVLWNKPALRASIEDTRIRFNL